MEYSKKFKASVMAMRKKGKSINAIAAETGLAKSTVWLWVRNVILSKSIRLLLEDAQLKGREKGNAINRARRIHEQAGRNVDAEKDIKRVMKHSSPSFWRLIVALLYWCEGEKTNFTTVRFMNSDPALVKTFLTALRSGFDLDENKFRVLMHLHSYHEEERQKHFWSELTKIPQEQFNKTFQKSHSGLQIHPGYEGCISIRYHDAKVAKTISTVYHAFANATEGEW